MQFLIPSGTNFIINMESVIEKKNPGHFQDFQVFKDTWTPCNTLADGLIERTSPMLDEIESKTMHKYKEGDQQRKKK